MITTAMPVLVTASAELNEKTTDASGKRVSYFNSAVSHLLSQFKWAWARKKGTITITSDTEYDLTALFPDYNSSWGIHSVEGADGKPLSSLDYTERKNFTSPYMSISPDNKSLVLTSTFTIGTVLTVWYYAKCIKVSDPSTTLSLPIPEQMEEALAIYVKYKTHTGKRQRYDARNALLDFKEKLDQLRLQEASNKIQSRPKIVPNFAQQVGLRRRY